MRYLDPAVITATQNRTVVARDLVWVTVRAFGSETTTNFGFSTLVRNLDIQVVDGRSGATVTRLFRGVGRAFKVGTIKLTADITVRRTDIELPSIDADVENMLRGYDLSGAPVQIYRAYFDPDTRAQIAPARPRFVGFIDAAPITTPKAGGTPSARITLVSTTRELDRASTDVRSHESQLARTDGADDFYIDTGVVGDWEIFWGKARAGGGISPVGGVEQ